MNAYSGRHVTSHDCTTGTGAPTMADGARKCTCNCLQLDQELSRLREREWEEQYAIQRLLATPKNTQYAVS